MPEHHSSMLRLSAVLLFAVSLVFFISGIVIALKAFSVEPYYVEKLVLNEGSVIRTRVNPFVIFYPNEIYGEESLSLYSDIPVYANLARELEIKYEVIVINGRMTGELSRIVKVIHQDGWYKIISEERTLTEGITRLDGSISINLTDLRTVMERLSRQAGVSLREFTLNIVLSASLELNLQDGVKRESFSHSINIIVDLIRNRVDVVGSQEAVKPLEEKIERMKVNEFMSITIDSWRKISITLGGIGIAGLALSQLLLWLDRERSRRSPEHRIEDITIEIRETLEEAARGAKVLTAKSLEEVEKLATLVGKPVLKTTDKDGNLVYFILLDEKLALAFLSPSRGSEGVDENS